MQERLSVGNAKLLQAESCLPHVHYFPSKGDEPSLIKDENEQAKKSYMRRVVCSKTSILVVLLLLLALTSYLLLEITEKKDNDIEEITVTERLLADNADPLKYQSIAYKHLDTNPLLSEELVEILKNAETEQQADESINDSSSQNYDRAPTEDEITEIEKEVHSDVHRLGKLMNEWSLLDTSDSFSSEAGFENTLSFVIRLMKALEEAEAPIKIAGSKIPEESNIDDKIWQSDYDDATDDTYSEVYDDDKPFNISDWFDHDSAVENFK